MIVALCAAIPALSHAETIKQTFQVSAFTVSDQRIDMDYDDEHSQVRMPQGLLYEVSVDQGDIEYSDDGFSVHLGKDHHQFITTMTIVY